MKELYLISLLDNLNTTLIIVCLFCCTAAIVLSTFIIMEKDYYNPDSEFESDKKQAKKYLMLLKWFNILCMVTSACLVIDIFIPSKKDMLLIYGGGKVIEFVDNDSIAKQLPHDAIEALHKYLTED